MHFVRAETSGTRLAKHDELYLGAWQDDQDRRLILIRLEQTGRPRLSMVRVAEYMPYSPSPVAFGSEIIIV